MKMQDKRRQLYDAEHEFLALYAFTKRYLCDIDRIEVQALEREMMDYFDKRHSDILDEIRENKGISDGLSKRINVAIESFKMNYKVNHFVGYGLSQEKLSIEGYGRFSPVASNEIEAGMAKNRRIEITITKNRSDSKEEYDDAIDSEGLTAQDVP